MRKAKVSSTTLMPPGSEYPRLCVLTSPVAAAAGQKCLSALCSLLAREWRVATEVYEPEEAFA